MEFPNREYVSLAMVRKAARLSNRTEQDFRNSHPSAMKWLDKKGQLFVNGGRYEYAHTETLKRWFDDNGSTE